MGKKRGKFEKIGPLATFSLVTWSRSGADLDGKTSISQLLRNEPNFFTKCMSLNAKLLWKKNLSY